MTPSSGVMMRPYALCLLCWAGLSVFPAHAAEPTTVGSASVSASQGITEVRIPLSGPAPVYSPFKASGPDRLIIDFSASSIAPGAAVSAAGMVTRGEFSTFNDGSDVVRLTLYVSGPFSHEIRLDGTTLVVGLSAGAAIDPLASALGGGGSRLSGPESGITGSALATLDFAYDERASRVILGVQDTEPATSQPDARTIVIDLPRAIMPSSLAREIDSERFASAVTQVRARPTRAGTRVEITLRQPAEYSIRRDGGLYIVEIPNPPELLARRAEAVQQAPVVAPSTPKSSGDKGVGNASANEVLIGATGRTSDPQTTFGAGYGSSDADALSFATDAPGSGQARYKGRRMSIDLQEADIHAVFRFIADTAELNIIASDDVQGTVTVRLKEVPWDQALAAVLQAKGMGAQRFGNIIRVAPIETIKTEQQAALEAKKAQDDLEPLQIYVAPLNYGSATEVSTSLTKFLSPRGSIEVDQRNNQLIVKDVEAGIAQMRELIKRVDRPNRAVSIEARFVEASSAFIRQLGVQWGSSVDASGTTGYSTGLFFPNTIGASGGISPLGNTQFYSPGADSLLVDMGTTGASSSAIAFSFGSIPGLIDLDARLSALESEGWGRIVSRPSIVVLDNTTATVKQGSQIPFETVSNGGTQVELVTAALEFKVTPHVTSDGKVFLDVAIKNNRPDQSQAVNGRPAIAIKELETEVLVDDGDTAVLGGVYSSEESFNQQRVPGLGSIPLLGYLFKNSSRSETTNELLVFITPRVVPE